nr:hypothetical protein [Herbaspirillum sp. ASV7]
MSRNDDNGVILLVGVAFVIVVSVSKVLGVDLETTGKVMLWGILGLIAIGVLLKLDTAFWPAIAPIAFLVMIPVLNYHALHAQPSLWNEDLPWYGSALWQTVIFLLLAGAAGYKIWRSRHYY